MVRIVCDSSNSLPDDLIARLNIVEVPAPVSYTHLTLPPSDLG